MNNDASRTLILIKPDAVKKNAIGAILKRFEDEGFKIKMLKMLRLSKEDAKEFYSVHSSKPFFNELVDFITSGPIVAAVIEGNSDDTIARVRSIIGATDTRKAEKGTIRYMYGTNITENAVHASDSLDSFLREVKVIFKDYEINQGFS
jgi:nucleoside-diphosphate kinase